MDLPRRSERPATRAPAAARYVVLLPFRVGDSPDVTPAGALVADGDVAPNVLSQLIRIGAVEDEVLVKARNAEGEAGSALERAGKVLADAVDRAGALGGALAVTRSTPVPSSAAEREARREAIESITTRCSAAEVEAREAAAILERARGALEAATAERIREEARVAAVVASLRDTGAGTPGEGA